MEEAMLWSREGKKARCFLCAFNCLIPEGEAGVCRVRVNEDDTLFTKSYGKIVSTKTSIIEKIPLYHFFPQSQALTITSNGANFEWGSGRTDKIKGVTYTPEDVIKILNKKNLRIVAFKEAEPTMFFEFAFKLARLAKRYNIKTVFVTNGYLTSEAVKKIGKYLDAVNVQFIASGDPEFYKQYMDVPSVDPIFEALRNFKKHRVFIEISNTIIPQVGENIDIHHKLVDWAINHLNSSIAYHLLKFTKNPRLKNIPETPEKTLEYFAGEAKKVGLRFPYIHGISGGEFETTYCYNCGNPVIARTNSLVKKIKLQGNRCPYCGFKLNIILE